MGDKIQPLEPSFATKSQEFLFVCPACKIGHSFIIGGGRGWTWDQNYQAPTVNPSILVRGTKPVSDEDWAAYLKGVPLPEPVPTVCHSFIRAGQIEFLSDCTHDMAGQTVPLPDIDNSELV